VRVCEIKGISQTLGRGVGFACLFLGLLPLSLASFSCLLDFSLFSKSFLS
jgi:hypothetical protein